MFQVSIRNSRTNETKFYYGIEVEVRPASWGDETEVWIKPEPKDRFFPHRNDEYHAYRTNDLVFIRTGRIYHGIFYEMDNLPEQYRNELIAEAMLKMFNQQEEKNENIPLVEY